MDVIFVVSLSALIMFIFVFYDIKITVSKTPSLVTEMTAKLSIMYPK